MKGLLQELIGHLQKSKEHKFNIIILILNTFS